MRTLSPSALEPHSWAGRQSGKGLNPGSVVPASVFTVPLVSSLGIRVASFSTKHRGRVGVGGVGGVTVVLEKVGCVQVRELPSWEHAFGSSQPREKI